MSSLSFPTIDAAEVIELVATPPEGDRIIAELRKIEDPHDRLIADIKSYVAHAHGKTSDRIAAGIVALRSIMLDADEWQEYHAAAVEAQAASLAALDALHLATLGRELEAQRMEAQRVEQGRIAAEQAERQRVLDAQAVEVALQIAEIENLRERAEKAERMEHLLSARLEKAHLVVVAESRRESGRLACTSPRCAVTDADKCVSAAEIERLRAALNLIAMHFSSEWPERCQSNVLTARHALTVLLLQWGVDPRFS